MERLEFIKDNATGAKAIRIGVGKRLDSNAIVPWIVKDVAGDGISGAGAVFRRDSNNTNSGSHWNALPQIQPILNGWLASDISANSAGYTWIASKPNGGGGGRLMVFDEQQARWFSSYWGGVATGSGEWVATDDYGMPWTVNSQGSMFKAD